MAGVHAQASATHRVSISYCQCPPHTMQWRHNGHDNVSNHQPHDCLLNRLFRRRSQKTSKLRVTGFCEGNSPVTGEFSAQMASNAENASIWWRHHIRIANTSIGWRHVMCDVFHILANFNCLIACHLTTFSQHCIENRQHIYDAKTTKEIYSNM